MQVKVLIPGIAVGAIIGKGGETMRNLKNESGCRVQMSKNQDVYPGLSLSPCLFPCRHERADLSREGEDLGRDGRDRGDHGEDPREGRRELPDRQLRSQRRRAEQGG